MRRRSIGILGLLLVGLVALALSWGTGLWDGEPPPAGAGRIGEVGHSVTAPGGAAADDPGGAPDLDADTAQREAVGVNAGDDIDLLYDLHGIVVDTTGRVQAGAKVRALRRPAEEFRLLDRSLDRALEVVAEGETGDDGTFALRLRPGQPYRLEVEAAGYPVHRQGGCYAGEFVRVELRKGATLQGRVLRAADRSPIEGARVFGWRDASGELLETGELFDGRTDAEGRFRFEGLEPGPLTFDVQPAEEASPRWIDLELAPGEEHEIEVLVEEGTEVRGRVVDAVTEAPVQGATVREGWSGGRVVVTDARGEFRLPGFDHFQIIVEAEGYAEAERVLRSRGTDEVPAWIEVRLQRGRLARGIVHGPDGAPLAGVYVAAAASDREGEQQTQRTDWIATRTEADGAFELEDLRPDQRHTLFLREEGFGTLVYEFPVAELELPVVDFGVIRMAEAASLRGTLVDENGAPIPGHGIQLWGTNADRFGGRAADPFEYRSIERYVAQRVARTDHLGRFSFTDLAAGTYRLMADVGGHGRYQTMDVAVARGERRDGVEFVVRRGLSIGGTVAAPDGGPLPTVYVSVDPQDGATTSADVEVEDGRFLASGLDAGAYTLSIYPYADDVERRQGRVFAWQKVKGVPAGKLDVEIVLIRAGPITGILLDGAGDPVHPGLVAARDADGTSLQSTSTDEEGRFVLTVPVDKAFTVVGRRGRAEGATEDPPWLARVPQVRAGDPEVTLQLRR